jgi:hypothetical protein
MIELTVDPNKSRRQEPTVDPSKNRRLIPTVTTIIYMAHLHLRRSSCFLTITTKRVCRSEADTDMLPGRVLQAR